MVLQSCCAANTGPGRLALAIASVCDICISIHVGCRTLSDYSCHSHNATAHFCDSIPTASFLCCIPGNKQACMNSIAVQSARYGMLSIVLIWRSHATGVTGCCFVPSGSLPGADKTLVTAHFDRRRNQVGFLHIECWLMSVM